MGKRDGEEEAVAHLKDCKDAKKIQAHQRRKRIEAEAAAVKNLKRAAQDEGYSLPFHSLCLFHPPTYHPFLPSPSSSPFLAPSTPTHPDVCTVCSSPLYFLKYALTQGMFTLGTRSLYIPYTPQ